MNTLPYERDFYAWTMQQADFIQTGKLDQLDLLHIAEELENMGKSEKRELESRLEVLLMHLLKWQFQPTYQSRSWKATIDIQRDKIQEHLADNPSLAVKLPEFLHISYRRAAIEAERETGLDRTTFPAICPWNIQHVLNEMFFPDS